MFEQFCFDRYQWFRQTSVKGLSLIPFPPAIITTEFLLSSGFIFLLKLKSFLVNKSTI